MLPLPYRLCAIDLDDTLLNHDHRISALNAQAVRAIAARGVCVVIASGRMHAATVRYALELGLDTPVISYNGAMVKPARDGSPWLHERIEPTLARPVMDYCRRHSLQLNFYLDDILWSAAETPWLDLYRSRTGSPVRVRPDMHITLRGKSPTKLLIVDAPAETDRLLRYFRRVFSGKLYVTKSNDEYLEFMPPGANKGTALALVASRLGLDREDTVAFGDSWNDLPMIDWAGLGLAVSNAKPEVRAAADRVIGSCNEDGVGKAVDEIFGLVSRPAAGSAHG